LIETGEETSQVDEGLLYVAETFGKEVLEETRRLSAIIDPVVTLGLGSMVLLVAVSIFLPMIQAVSSISNM
jgi:MSHA biogenesis protein MshG